MNSQELAHMEEMLKSKTPLKTLCTDPTWLHAFAYYNVLAPVKLDNHCLRCYMTVYLYHKKQYDANRF